jgi:hypothetical protein
MNALAAYRDDGWLARRVMALLRARAGARLGWLLPPLLRVVEYGSILLVAALAGPSCPPAAFALLAAIAFHQYDVVYRLRHQGVAPPRWLDAVALGWDGRVLLAWALLVAGLLPVAMFVWAAALAFVLVVESAVSWARFSRAPGVALDEDDGG